MIDLNKATGSNEFIQEAIIDQYDYHTWTPEQIANGKRVRTALENAVAVIIECVPPSPDRSVALRKLRECRMDCNSSITHRGRY